LTYGLLLKTELEAQVSGYGVIDRMETIVKSRERETRSFEAIHYTGMLETKL
jgi:hypothetical protein